MRPFIPCLMFITLVVAGALLRADPSPAAAASAATPAAPVATTAAPATLAPAHLSPTATTPAEAELGKKVCAQIEKAYKLVKDEKAVQRVTTIANNIAPYTQRPDVVYKCKVLNSSEINAESIPGGNIYITKGLLDAVESDDELAGVLAHEIAHNSLYHVKKEMEKQSRANVGQVLALLASVYIEYGRVDYNTAEFYLMAHIM